MQHECLRTGSIIAALLAGSAFAIAQQPSPPASEQQQMQQEKAQQTPSGQMGKEEPSAHAPVSKPQSSAVFVNGALAVAGAPTDSDTVPAKYSEQNAADDKLVTIGYTFKNLDPKVRQAIWQSLKDQPAGAAFNADLAVQLPPSIELRPLPNDVTARVPQTAGYQYAVASNRVLLVSPLTRVVVGVFSDLESVQEGQGRR